MLVTVNHLEERQTQEPPTPFNPPTFLYTLSSNLPPVCALVYTSTKTLVPSSLTRKGTPRP